MEVREASAAYAVTATPLVPKGYKQTEVGVIPEDWDVKSASQIGTPVRGGSPRPASDSRYFNGSYIPWLTVAALTNIPASQLVVSETATCLTEEGSLHSRTLTPGTLIIANSGATLGIAKILGVKCCANDGIAALLSLSSNVSPRYLAHFINTKTSYLREVVATGNGQPNLNTELIGGFKIPLPPTKAEQEAIAEALSDADALIESLEHLLAKKRHLKQGAMQELLTGKKRLPGFSGEWRACQLDDVINHCSSGATPYRGRPGYYKGTVKWITSGELNYNVITDSIRLNTDLARKPRECIEYIVVHEMTHLLEPTHNARFVALMDQFMPSWRPRRDQLNQLPVRHEEWVY